MDPTVYRSYALLTQLDSYLTHFEGHQDCGISSQDIYIPPSTYGEHGTEVFPFCQSRARLLEAMSGGGRHGFDTPFFPKGCDSLP